MSDSKISIPNFSGEPLTFTSWHAKIISSMLTHQACHFFMTMAQLEEAVRDSAKREEYIDEEGDIITDAEPAIEYDETGKANEKSVHNHKSWTRKSDAAKAIESAMRNACNEYVLLRIQGDAADHTSLDRKELYTNLVEAFGTLTQKEVTILKSITQAIDPAKTMRNNILTHDDAYRQLAAARREQSDADQRDNLIELLRSTKYDSTVTNWQAINTSERKRTYKSLCDQIIRAEEDGAVHSTAPSAVRNAAMSAVTTDPLQALQAQLTTLTSVVSAMAATRGPSPVTTATKQTRRPIPTTAPAGKPHWCPTHLWNATHPGAECTNKGKHHEVDITPAACEVRKAKAATDRGITTTA